MLPLPIFIPNPRKVVALFKEPWNLKELYSRKITSPDLRRPEPPLIACVSQTRGSIINAETSSRVWLHPPHDAMKVWLLVLHREMRNSIPWHLLIEIMWQISELFFCRFLWTSSMSRSWTWSSETTHQRIDGFMTLIQIANQSTVLPLSPSLSEL